ncbi:MAG TPA: dihydropteroate synthase [Terriglobales bacterium]|nr:dihydropteroate synthase [Terriglobales bacterium]
MRPVFRWKVGSRVLELGRRTLVMGIVNITPDSFSDGGRYYNPDHAIEHALGMLEEGADIIDIGGESTRPGARVVPQAEQIVSVSDPAMGSGSASGQDCVATAAGVETELQHQRAVPPPAVSAEEELRRVLPVIRQVRRAVPQAILSVDTYKAEVARQAVEAGAEIINDVSAFRWDPLMAQTVARSGCGAILMHMRGRPEEWRNLPSIRGEELLELVASDLREWATAAEQQGIRREQIVVDPGFGFGKNYFENYPLLARLGELHRLGYPLLAGTSRKSFIGRTVGRGGESAPPTQRLYGTLASVTASVLAGAHVVRVHDVTPAIEACAVADAVLSAQRQDRV